jgi:hypothetical protein
VVPLALAIAALAPTVLSGQQRVMRDQRDRMATGSSMIAGVVVESNTEVSPIRRVEVRVSSVEGGASQTTYTDDAGRFAFPTLAAGRYTLAASKPGYLRAAYGARRHDRPGTPITLGEGQQLADLRLTLSRGGVITGRITDQHGLPAAGVDVRVMEIRTVLGERQLRPARTYGGLLGESADDRGIYRLYGLPPGEYVVVASPRLGPRGEIRAMTDREIQEALRAARQPAGRRGAAPTNTVGGGVAAGGRSASRQADEDALMVGVAPIYYPGTSTAADAATIRLGPGEERPAVDFTLPLVQTASIEGGVVAPPGVPPQGVQLLLVATGQAGMAGLGGPGLLNRATPNTEGVFSFTAVPPGRYTLTARAVLGRGGRGSRGRATMAFQSAGGGPPMILQDAGDGAPVYWATADLTVNGQDLAGIVLALQPGMTLSGQAVFEGNASPPEDLSSVRVSLAPAPVGGTTVSMGLPSTDVDETGLFSITNVTPGRYRISASVPGSASGFRFQTWSLKSAVFNGVDVLDFPLDIGPNDNIADAVLTFTDVTQKVTGTLQDATGRPAPDYTIVVFANDPGYWTPQGRRVRTTRSGTDGSFQIDGLPAGDYRIAAVTDIGPEESNDPAFLEQLVVASVQFQLAEGGTWVQDLRIAGGRP